MTPNQHQPQITPPACPHVSSPHASRAWGETATHACGQFARNAAFDIWGTLIQCFLVMVAQIEEIPGKEPRSRRITASDVRSMGDLLAKRITESGACQILGIKYDTWRKFKVKGKNAARFANVLEHAREKKIKAHIENIEDAAVGAGPHARADFRASLAILELTDRQRFGRGDEQQTAQQSATITIDRMKEIMAIMAPAAGQLAAPVNGPVIDVQPVPALPAAMDCISSVETDDKLTSVPVWASRSEDCTG